MNITRHRAWLWPLLAMAIVTPFTPTLDLAITRYFYQDGHFTENAFTSFMFTYGVLPADLLFVGSCLVLLGSYILSRLKKYRAPALSIFLTLALGSGLVTHALLKDHWGRPRPRQVIEFGGMQTFRPYYQPNFFHQPEPSKSFPCGHCTMGFYFFALALAAKRLGSKALFWASLIIAFGLGGLLSYARIEQGGHFLSDTLASALIMWLAAYACDQWTAAHSGGNREGAD